MEGVLNIAAYRFAPLSGLKELRSRLIGFCRGKGLKGTILLSNEGINLFVAGGDDAVRSLLARLAEMPGLANLEVKESRSAEQPFRRMLVRIKREIISFGVDWVDPVNRATPRVHPAELRDWLDEGRKLVLLDTRNDYEVRMGTFRGALDPGIASFRDFPEAVSRLPEAMKEETVVVFCTGGIRCEKAGPFLEGSGFRKVYQLDGGILRYFEECGGAHFDGSCFVFDGRVGLDPELRESGHEVCYACQATLEAADLADPRFEEGVSCPHCHRSDAERIAMRVSRADAGLRRITEVLPGSVPALNRRPLNVPGAYDRRSLGEVLAGLFPHIGPAHWDARIAAGGFLDPEGRVMSHASVVRGGWRIEQRIPDEIEPPVACDVRVLHDDGMIVVIDKPAPLPMHPCGRFRRNTLQHWLAQLYHPSVPRPVHRIDANTTGVVVFALTRRFCRALQRQFEEGRVRKSYLVGVHGHPEWSRYRCEERISAVSGPLGARCCEEDGRESLTHFEVLSRNGDGTTLLRADPVTGRTNQIRLHLAGLGHPVLGDRCYRGGGLAAELQTLSPEDEPLRLHAWRLAFRHPAGDAEMEFEATPPAWAREVTIDAPARCV